MLFLLFIVAVVQCQESFKAEFSMNGVKGHVEFTETAKEQTTTSYKLSGITGSTQVSIHTFPVFWDTADHCSESVLGSSLHTLNAIDAASQGSATQQSTDFDLVGSNSIQGRSLLLVSSQGRSCATIEKRGSSTQTAMVRLKGPVGGTVIFREAGPEVTMVTDLFLTDAGNSGNFTWELKTRKVAESKDISAICANLGSTISNGDLSAVHGDVPVAARTGDARSFYLDTKLSIPDLEGNSLKVSHGNKVACANIHKFKGKNTLANFNMDGVTGYINFRQPSPFDPVEVDGSLKNLRNLAKNFHIHYLPVPPRVSKDDNLCNSVSTIYNPFNIDTSKSPAASVGSNDQYQVGDLSGKYGTLENKDDYQIPTTTDWNMNMYFENGIIGRSVVIHKAARSQWICGTLNLPYSDVKTAVATFKYPVIGQIFFQQDLDDPSGDTTVYTSLGHNDGSAATSYHNFHVHVSPVGGDMDSDTGRCQSAGGHYNPWSVSVQTPYTTDCSPSYPDRCELGDSSKKGGTLDIGDSQGNWKRKFYTDINLPLAGSFSIIGRSIVIHAENRGPGRIACADIVPLNPKYVTAYQWSTALSGFITWKQDHPFDMTNTLLDVVGLRGQAGPWHIHLRPVPLVQNPCSNEIVGGHFNPFQIDPSSSPPPGNGTLDQYEVGDLSGKFGKVTGKQIVKDRFYDYNNFLYGQHSIMGRSLVFHKDADGSRWTCANITLNETKMAAGEWYRASVNFATTSLVGHILLAQYVMTDGSMTETSINYDIAYTDPEKKTNNHKWHVHEKPVGAGNSKCSSTGPHFNPFHADVTGSYSTDCSVKNPLRCELGDLSGKQGSNIDIGSGPTFTNSVSFQGSYSTDCSVKNPLRCELGDLSGKQGFNIDIGSGPIFTNDVDLPLTGKYSVVGRSMVIHDKDAGPGRFVCADILPVDALSVPMTFKSTSTYTKSALVTKLAAILATDPWNIVIAPSLNAEVDSDCTEVTVLLSGPKKSSMHQSLKNMVSSKSAKLGEFTATDKCHGTGSITTISALLVLTTTLMTLLFNN